MHLGQTNASAAGENVLGARELSRLKWRCRRGLLENDLFIQRFFECRGKHLSQRDARGLQALIDLSDNDLLDLLLRRSEPTGELNRPEVHEVLALMRKPPPELSI